MASIIDQLATELGVPAVTVRAALGGGETRSIKAKIATVQAARDEALLGFETTLNELNAALVEAQKREDTELGKG